MPTAQDIVNGALQEINVIPQGGSPGQDDATYALTKLNDLLDEWAARKVRLYDVKFPVYTLSPGLQPHTIGPAGTVTASALLNNVATYQVQNNFANGAQVTVSGTANGGGVMNTTGIVQAATASQISVPIINVNVASAADTGTIVLASNPVPTFPTPLMGQRPQTVEQATLILTSSNPSVDLPLDIRDEQWWMNQRVKSLTSNVPTDLYYDPNWPNGSLYFWPVPASAYGVRLKVWGILQQLPGLSYAFSLPPGYQKAIKLSLARDMVGSFQGSWNQQQENSWAGAMKAVESNNQQSPRGDTIDAGMPGANKGGDFNYQSGTPNGR